MLFGVASGIDRGIVVLDGSTCVPKEKGCFGIFSPHWFEWHIF